MKPIEQNNLNPNEYLSKLPYKSGISWIMNYSKGDDGYPEFTASFSSDVNLRVGGKKSISFEEKDIVYFEQEGKQYWNVDKLFDSKEWTVINE